MVSKKRTDNVIQFPVRVREPEVVYTIDGLFMSVPCNIWYGDDGFLHTDMLFLPPPNGEPIGFYHHEPIEGHLWPAYLFWLGRGEPEIFTPKEPREWN